MSDARSGSRPSPLEWVWIPIVGAALLLIYLPGLDNGLVYDDSYLVEGLFAEYASIFQFRQRLLSYGSFVWVQELFGEGFWKQRLFNLFIHFAVTFSLWGLYREILRRIEPPADEASTAAPYYRSPALGVAIGFFALNPVAVYAVAYLIQRSILVATLFTILALWLFARGLRLRKPSLHMAAVVCYLLAVLSKEHAILAPLAAVPLYILLARPSWQRLAVLGSAGLVVMAAAGTYLYVHFGHIIGTPFDEYSHVYLEQLSRLAPEVRKNAFPLSVLNESWLFFRYGFDWMLPWSGRLSINLRPPFPLGFASFPHVFGAAGYLAVLVGGFFLLLRYRDWRALVGLALLFPALLYGTEFVTVWVQDPFSLYRSYLWAIGIPGLVFLALHGTPPRVLIGVGLVLAALLVWQAVDRVRSMATPERAWSDAIAKLPNDPRSVGRWFPYLNRGAVYVDQNLFNLASRDFEASAALGDQGMGMFNLGSVLNAQRRHADALQAFDRARAQGFKLASLSFQRGIALLAVGRVEEGYREMAATLEASPSSPTREAALLHLGRAAMHLGRRDEAVSALQQLVSREPFHEEGRSLLAMAYVMRGEAQKALEVSDPMVREKPSARAYYARAMANFALKRKAEAAADIDEAVKRAPEDQVLRQWQAKIRAMP